MHHFLGRRNRDQLRQETGFSDMRNRTFIALVAIALMLALVAGVLHLFHLRFRTGDVYPVYSSLRTDPLGTKALYESFSSCAGLKVSRSYEPYEKLIPDPGTALLCLGVRQPYYPNRETAPADTIGAFNTFVRKGGRLVITMLPRNWNPEEVRDATNSLPQDATSMREKRMQKEQLTKESETEQPQAETGEGKKTGGKQLPETRKTRDRKHRSVAGKKTDEKKSPAKRPPKRRNDEAEFWESVFGRQVSVTNWLGLSFVDAPITGVTAATLSPKMSDTALPPSIACHTSICFTNVSDKWSVVYERCGRPVVVERQIGKGTFVLSALTFFVSNEAMRVERYPELLAWIVRGHNTIVFDEYHNGMVREPGVAVLMRKYRLQWLGAALLVLAVLFVWQRSASLVPAASAGEAGPEDGKPEIAKGKDSLSGLVNLLRRNIPAGQILNACVGEWKKLTGRRDRRVEEKIRQIESIAEEQKDILAGEKDHAEAYNRICRMLEEK